MTRWNASAYEYALKACMSPIERKLFRPLMFVQPLFLDPDIEGCILTDHEELHLVPQYRGVAPYIADFALLVTPRGTPDIKVLIECDGHEFHQTKEAAAHDARRNRDFTALGWAIQRFTGSEIHADPEGCVNQVAAAIDGQYVGRILSDAELRWRSLQSDGGADA